MKVCLTTPSSCFRNTLSLVTFLLASYCLQGQYTSNQSTFWQQVRYGGGVGLGFFNGGFNASVAPSAIYPVSKSFAAGAGLNVNYSKFESQRLLAYGASVLGLYSPIPQIQLSAEFEQLRVNRSFNNLGDNFDDDYWLPGLFLGIGYATRNTTVGLRYDLLFDEQNSIYGDRILPFVRFYF